MVPHRHRATLAALLDRLIPRDAWPSAVDSGAMARFDDLAAAPDHRSDWDGIGSGLLALDADACAHFGRPFVELGSVDQDILIAAAERGASATIWPVPSRAFVDRMAQLAAEGFYAPRGAASWEMIGYDAAPKRPPGADVVHVEPVASPFSAIEASYDIVIVGAGAGGGVAAAVLAEAGARVLLVDRGRFESLAEVGRAHDGTHRLGLNGFNTAAGLELGPRTHVDAAGAEVLANVPHHPRWYANAFTVGGGTRVYQGMAWRFHPADFRLASTYGVLDGTSIADWPLTYDELEPFYSRAAAATPPY